MTTPTPMERVDALLRFEFGPTGEPFPAHALLAMIQLARELASDLAARDAELAAMKAHEGDEIVRELRQEISHQSSLHNEYQDFDECYALVDNLNARITQDAQEKAALKAELASVKAERDALKRVHDDIMQAVGECGSYKP